MATYLRNLPNALYDFSLKTDVTSYVHVVPDIATKVTMYIDPDSVADMCEQYQILQGETPEIIADKYYGNPELHWTILIINKISDLGTEWPLTDYSVSELAKDLYGDGNLENIHHYEYEGIEMDEDFIEATYGVDTALPITNLEYEVQENEGRRMILLIKPHYIGNFVQNFEATLKT